MTAPPNKEHDIKKNLIKIFWPVLRFFETGTPDSSYKHSHRMALIFVGILFLFLAVVAGVSAQYVEEMGGAIPVVVFSGIGLVSLIVGTLGSNSAVCKIWGSKT